MRPAGPVARLLWRALALVFVALGLIGAFLPVLPTVPFLLAAAWAAGRGWPALEDWLLGHPAMASTSASGANAERCRAARNGPRRP